MWQRLGRTIASALTLVVSAARAGGAQEVTSRVAAQLMADASFVFGGTVVRLGASTVGSGSASGSDAVVVIDDVVKASPSLRNYQGKQVTVRLPTGSALKPGESTVFFTDLLIASDGLLLRALGIASNVPPLFLAQPTVAAQTISAAVVLTGRILSVSDVQPERLSENERQWSAAEVEVQSVEKGYLSGQERITFRFPREERSFTTSDAPIRPGTVVTLFLPEASRDASADGRAYWVIRDAENVRPPSAGRQVRAILERLKY